MGLLLIFSIFLAFSGVLLARESRFQRGERPRDFTEKERHCPHLFKYIPSHRKCLRLFEKEGTHAQQKALCKKYSARIVEITDCNLNGVVQDMLLGASGEHPRFSWMQKAGSYANCVPNMNEPCVQMPWDRNCFIVTAKTGYWYLKSCAHRKASVICELKAKVTQPKQTAKTTTRTRTTTRTKSTTHHPTRTTTRTSTPTRPHPTTEPKENQRNCTCHAFKCRRSAQRCPSAEWCYFKKTDSCYLLLQEPHTTSWTKMRESCTDDHQADLVSIHSQEENDYVSGLAASDTGCTGIYSLAYIGLSVTESGKQNWTDGTKVNYTAFDEPSLDSFERDDDCQDPGFPVITHPMMYTGQCCEKRSHWSLPLFEPNAKVHLGICKTKAGRIPPEVSIGTSATGGSTSPGGVTSGSTSKETTTRTRTTTRTTELPTRTRTTTRTTELPTRTRTTTTTAIPTRTKTTTSASSSRTRTTTTTTSASPTRTRTTTTTTERPTRTRTKTTTTRSTTSTTTIFSTRTKTTTPTRTTTSTTGETRSTTGGTESTTGGTAHTTIGTGSTTSHTGSTTAHTRPSTSTTGGAESTTAHTGSTTAHTSSTRSTTSGTGSTTTGTRSTTAETGSTTARSRPSTSTTGKTGSTTGGTGSASSGISESTTTTTSQALTTGGTGSTTTGTGSTTTGTETTSSAISGSATTTTSKTSTTSPSSGPPIQGETSTSSTSISSNTHPGRSTTTTTARVSTTSETNSTRPLIPEDPGCAKPLCEGCVIHQHQCLYSESRCRINSSIEVLQDWGGYCLNEVNDWCYKLIFNTEAFTHAEAEKLCQADNGHLASAHDSVESFYLAALGAFDGSCGSNEQTKKPYRGLAWIGLQATKGELSWTNGSPVNWTEPFFDFTEIKKKKLDGVFAINTLVNCVKEYGLWHFEPANSPKKSHYAICQRQSYDFLDRRTTGNSWIKQVVRGPMSNHTHTWPTWDSRNQYEDRDYKANVTMMTDYPGETDATYLPSEPPTFATHKPPPLTTPQNDRRHRDFGFRFH